MRRRDRHRILVAASVRPTSAFARRRERVRRFGMIVSPGGLIFHVPNLLHQYGRTVGYVDRILRDGKPADQSVQTRLGTNG